jgi:hypothetical protein
MRIRRVILLWAACLVLPYFSILSFKGHVFGKTLLSTVGFDFHCKLFCEIYLFPIRIQRCVSINLHTFSCNMYFILVIFSWNLNIFYGFSNSNRVQTFMIIRAMGAELFHAIGRTDGHIWRNGYSLFETLLMHLQAY